MSSWSSSAESGRSRGRLRARLLVPRDRDVVLAHLGRAYRDNLLLIEMVACVGRPPSASEPSPQIVVVWRGRQIEGVGSLRPSVVLDADMSIDALDACMPLLAAVETGLIKSAPRIVDPLWERLARRGRSALIDRRETAYVLDAARAPRVASPCPPDASLRRASERDLEDLVDAARASLREEDRPDPFEGDPIGFRRWVRGRLQRARIVDWAGRAAFVGYADVRRPEGWLIQGVYTWPEHRRRGLARIGMEGLIREAFDSGTDHVQLAVVEGNHAAVGLYTGLGFEPLSELRTVLFA